MLRDFSSQLVWPGWWVRPGEKRGIDEGRGRGAQQAGCPGLDRDSYLLPKLLGDGNTNVEVFRSGDLGLGRRRGVKVPQRPQPLAAPMLRCETKTAATSRWVTAPRDEFASAPSHAHMLILSTS